MNKILITGCNGQLGTELGALLPDAIKTDHNTLDIRDADAVKRFVDKNKIETIVNCAAYTAVDKAEDDFDTALKINAKGPKNLADTGAKIIHISTDYVFPVSGPYQKNRPYKTDDPALPESIYGITKRKGEELIWTGCPSVKNATIIIRTAWLYSPYGNNFVKTMLRLGETKSDINVVNDQIGTPTYAADLAKAIVTILPQMNRENSGIYHFTDEGVCSWYDFATEIMTMAELPCNVHPISTAEYPTRAKRPAYSVLDKSKIKKVFDVDIPYWRKSLQNCLEKILVMSK